MKINWKVRLKNKLFLATFASQTALMIQGVLAGLVGLGILDVNMVHIAQEAKVSLGIVDTVLLYLSFLGIIHDPTTSGVGDSEQAMNYDEPKK